MRLEYTPEAAEDISEAFFWYEAHQSALGERFLQAVTQSLERVLEQPSSYRVVAAEVRLAPVRGFPYSVYYKLAGNTVIVLSCFHQRRDPETWMDRV